MLGLLAGLSVLRMADGLVTLVDKGNLKGASLLVRKVFGLGGQRAQEDVGNLLHQTSCSQRCLHLSGLIKWVSSNATLEDVDLWRYDGWIRCCW